MQFINISLVLAASLASTVQAHVAKPNLHPRSYYDNSTYPDATIVVVSPIPVAPAPLGTGVSSSVVEPLPMETAVNSSVVDAVPTGTGVSSSVFEALSTKVTNATLTYTMGTGTAMTVVTTTVLRSETVTRTHTVYATLEKPVPLDSSIVQNVQVVTSTLPGGVELTTTITDRSTTTRTVTVESVYPTSGGGGVFAQVTDVANVGATNNGGGPAPTGCAPAVTVTETIQSTITVTAFPSSVVNPAALSSTPGAAGSSVSVEAPAANPIPSPSPIPSPADPAPSIPSPPSSSAAVPVYANVSAGPYINGTATSPQTPKKKCSRLSSGFVTMATPSASPAPA